MTKTVTKYNGHCRSLLGAVGVQFNFIWVKYAMGRAKPSPRPSNCCRSPKATQPMFGSGRYTVGLRAGLGRSWASWARRPNPRVGGRYACYGRGFLADNLLSRGFIIMNRAWPRFTHLNLLWWVRQADPGRPCDPTHVRTNSFPGPFYLNWMTLAVET